MKKAKKPETNAIYRLKIGMGFEPLDDLDYILKVLEERKQHKNNK